VPLYSKLLFSMAFLAVGCDLKTEKIPNEAICLFWGVGFIYRILTKGWEGFCFYLAGAALPFAVMAGLFIFRMTGAGDIKLLSALGGVMGPTAIFKCILVSFFAGAILSAAILAETGSLKIRLRYFAGYFQNIYFRKTIVPYCQRGKRLENIHFSVPVFMAVMLHIGGFYS
jgi:prepilin peptidase CpaA